MSEPPVHFDKPADAGVGGAEVSLGVRAEWMLRSVILIVTGLVVGYLFFTRERLSLAPHYLGVYMIVFLNLVAFVLLQLKKIRSSVQLVAWGIILAMLGNSLVVSGVRTPGLMTIPAVIALAAWLAGLRTALVMTLVTGLFVVGLTIAEFNGFEVRGPERAVPAYAAVLIATLLVTYAVAYSSTEGFADQLRRISELGRGQAVQVQALRASEERFAALFRANPVPSSTNDQEGRILDVNRAWSAMFGFPVESVIGKTTLELGIWAHGESRRTILDALQQQGRVDGAPLLLKVADGQIRPFRVFIAPVEFGGKSRYVTSLLDQSDREAAERAQAQVTEQLEARVALRTTELTRTLEQLMGAQEELLRAEKLASLGAMVAGISHELNTPIGNTVTVASTMHHQVQEFGAKVHAGNLKRSDLSSFLELMLDMSDVLSRSTTRAAELISSFKQVAVDQASERRRDFNVKELVDDIVTSVRAGMREGVASISHDVPEDLQCDSYPGPVGQILLNLIQNAQVHAFHGRDAGHIHIQAREVQGQLVMTVADDGVGMTPEVLKRAFDPFFTTRLGKGGSGLGLSLSYRLATATLGGNLTVSSSVDRGCCFTLTYPCRAPVDATVAFVTPEPMQGS